MLCKGNANFYYLKIYSKKNGFSIRKSVFLCHKSPSNALCNVNLFFGIYFGFILFWDFYR